MRYRAFIFGVAHSPWTQCAMLACAAKGVEFELSANWFRHWRRIVKANGYVIPTLVLIDAGSEPEKVISVIGGSFEIMKALDLLVPDACPLGLPEDGDATAAERVATEQGKLEELFFEGAFERLHPLPRKLWEFPVRFASQPDLTLAEPTVFQRCTRAALKAFLLLHFGNFLLLGNLSSVVTGHPRIHDRRAVARLLDYWEASICARDVDPGGSGMPPAASYLDLALYAQLQMNCTGLSASMLARVRERPRLVAFIHRMNTVLDAYRSTNYCRDVFQCASTDRDGSSLQSAPPLEVVVTLTTALFLCTLGLPILMVFLAHAYVTRANSTEASGKKLNPQSYWGKITQVPLGVR